MQRKIRKILSVLALALLLSGVAFAAPGDWRYEFRGLAATRHMDYVGRPQSQGFTNVQEIFLPGPFVMARVGDVDGDNINDAVFVSGSKLTIKYGNSDKPQVQVDMPAVGIRPILADVTEDGIPEIIVGSYRNPQYQLNIFQGNGSLYKRILGRVGQASDYLYLHLFPIAYLGNNRIVALYDAGYSKDPRGLVAFNIETGAEEWYYDVAPRPSAATVADFDNDQKLELHLRLFTPHNGAVGTGNNGVGTRTYDGDLYTLVVDEDGNEEYTYRFGADTAGGSNGFNNIAVADLDGDGTLELVSTVGHYSSYSGDAQIRILDAATGAELHRVSTGYNTGPMISVADLDGDGKKEIVATTRSLNGPIFVFDHALNLKRSVTTLGAVRALADIDGDGVIEILLSYYNQIRVLNSQTLELEWSHDVNAPGTNISEIIPANIDRDSFVEIIVTQAGKVAILQSNEVENEAPVAAAGENQLITSVGQEVTLDGSQSYDNDGDALVYAWNFVSKPDGSMAEIVDPTSAVTSFAADTHGNYEVELTVTDPSGEKGVDTITIGFENIVPVADSGINLSIIQGETAYLDGRASSDANGDSLTCRWAFVARPEGSVTEVDAPDAAMASFMADQAGEYVVSLIVNDGFVDSLPDNVTVVAASTLDALTQVLMELQEKINALADDDLKNKNMRKTLTSKVNVVLKLAGEGDYVTALEKLNDDIVAKINGCAQTGSPDKNDWIVVCGAQAQTYPLAVKAMNLLWDM